MRSDAHVAGEGPAAFPSPVADALASQGESFQAAVAAAAEEIRGLLARLTGARNGRTEQAAHALGMLAAGPVDPERFAALLDPGETMEPERLGWLERAASALAALAGERAGFVSVSARDGEDVRDTVARGLAAPGRVFGAARVVALLRSGAFAAGEHERYLSGVPFGEWRSAERELAPPVVADVPGSALSAVAGLAEFLDGRVKLVLVVGEPCPPAPLARLLAPGTLVLQTSDPDELARVASFPGPAVAALVPATAAGFLYDPGAGPREAGHLEIRHMPDPGSTWIDGISPAQQATELRLLETWSRIAAAGAAPPQGSEAAESRPAAEPADPAERLAAWLLSQAEPGEASPG